MKRKAKDYANESTIHTMKVIESLEGLNFEPVAINTIIERAEMPPGVKPLTYDKAMRVLITLELLGWAKKNDQKKWSLTAKILRFSERYSQIAIASIK